MDIRSLAVASLTFFLCVIGSAGAEDVKIMGLMDTTRGALRQHASPRLPDGELSEKVQAHEVPSE